MSKTEWAVRGLVMMALLACDPVSPGSPEEEGDGPFAQDDVLGAATDPLQRLLDHQTMDEPRPFSLVVLPDTQYYSAGYPEVFLSQTEWIRDNKEALNIAFVLHEGDLTDLNSPDQWAVAQMSMAVLDDEVPYSVCVGNHDMGLGGTTMDRASLFNIYFPASRYEQESWYGGHHGDSYANHYALFEASGLAFLILSLEFGPRDEVLDWARGVLDSYPERRAIVLTHCYMYYDGTRVGPGDQWNPHDYPLATLSSVNDGEEMWSKLISLQSNIFLVLSGHILDYEGNGRGRLTSQGELGQRVHQLFANFQLEPHGGDGWLRIVEFIPQENTISVYTFSPYRASKGYGGLAWREDEVNRFDLFYEMKEPGSEP